MNALDAVVRSWPSDPWLACGLIVTAAVYFRGWRWLRRRDAQRWSAARLSAFVGALAAVYLALASPIATFATLVQQAHMAQHLLLMMVAPPLLWLGAPLLPLVRGLPRVLRTTCAAPLLRWPLARRAFARLTHPAVAWPLFVVTTWAWHAPRAYELALSSQAWHYVEHACFLATGLVFWYPVVRPYPARPTWNRWLLAPYLLLADVQNTALAALLTFSDRVWYPHYVQTAPLAGWSAVDDQAAAGVMMWVPGSIAYLAPLFWIGLELLYGKQRGVARVRRGGADTPVRLLNEPLLSLADRNVRTTESVRATKWARSIPRRSPHGSFNVLNLPLVGAFLRWRHARTTLQLAMLALAAAMIYDGLTGPAAAPFNLAGVLPWIHWRGLLIFGLLVVGNVFCMACPFTLPRAAARRWMRPGRMWPRRLRSKWLAVALVAVFLWAYEAFSLWNSPWITAWIALAYFAAAFVVDSLFRDGAFCKYVCPIGQFNFVQSLVSPLEIKVVDAGVCATCRTRECIRGDGHILGCQTKLFVPRKAGNLDCTLCLDCVRACPHANVGLLAVAPARQLWRDRGRLARRLDLAALVVVLAFGAFANAAAMTAPVVELEAHVQGALGIESRLPTTAAFFAAWLIAIPAVAVGLATLATRRWGAVDRPWPQIAARYAYALAPIAFAMWLAHYGFHFLTSYETAVPVARRFAADLGWSAIAPYDWSCACCQPASAALLRLELLALDIGLLASLYTAYRMARGDASGGARAAAAVAPWAALIVGLYAAGAWIVFQPMEMRGTLGG